MASDCPGVRGSSGSHHAQIAGRTTATHRSSDIRLCLSPAMYSAATNKISIVYIYIGLVTHAVCNHLQDACVARRARDNSQLAFEPDQRTRQSKSED